MKENSFYSDDFEELIRGKTEQYKMYPSENVWKGVHNALHTKRKWFIGSMSLLVTGILFMAGRELILPSKNTTALHKTAAVNTATDASRSTAENTRRAPLAVLRPANASAAARHNDSDNNTIEWDPAIASISVTISHPALTQSDLSGWLSHVVKLPAEAPDLDVDATAVARNTNEDQRTTGDDQRGAADGQHGVADNQHGVADGQRGAGDDQRLAGDGRTAADTRQTGSDGVADGVTAQNVLESLSARSTHENSLARTGTSLQTSRSNRNGVNGMALLSESPGTATKASATEIAESEDAQRVNWLHDYAMNILEATPKSGRTYLQLSLSPTVSYRNLGGSDIGADKYPTSSTPLGGPNSYIDHRAAFGFGASGSILYRLTRNLSVKGGLQFNFARFPIKAFSSDASGSATTLQTPYGNMMDSISSVGLPLTRTSNKSTPVTVNNDYYQLSAPIGFELRVLGNERLTFNLGATIAPSYLLNSSSYMLEGVYTRYDKNPAMYRKLNFYAGAEAFLSYRMGNVNLQIGPEFRYQLLSSYTSKESITENLKSYGLKIGIVKSLP